MRSTRTFAIAALILTTVACGRGSDDSDGATADLSTGTTFSATAVPVTARGPAFSQQSGAVVIAGADQYLAAWTELRLATMKTTVSVARISKDGALLDEKPIALPGLGGDDSGIAVAFDGAGGYLAVWSHKTGSTSVINGVRIGSDGALLDAQPLTLGRANGKAITPAVAYTTGGYLVAWSDDRDSGATADSYVNEIYGARVSTTGQIAGAAEGFRITNVPGTLTGGLSLAAVSGTFMVGFAKKGTSGSLPSAVRVSDAGAVLDATPIAFGTSGGAPSIATDGNQFFAAWTDTTTHGLRISKDGAKVDQSPINISDSKVDAAVVWDGEAFSVAWDKGAQRIGANGVLIGGMRASTALAAQARPAMASLGSSLFVIHTVDTAGLPSHLSGNILPKGDGAPIKSDITLARGPASFQTSVATAANGATSLSVWLEYEDATHPKVNGAVFSSGTMKPIAIDPGTTVNGAPSVAFDGTNFAVAWQADADSKLVHVNDAGQLLDQPAPFAGGSPMLTGGGEKTLLTTSAKSYLMGSNLTFERAAEKPGWTAGPTAKPVWDGGRFVLAWAATNGTGSAEIHVQRFDKNGRELDRPAMKLATLPAPAGAPLPQVTMAGAGQQTLIAWTTADHQIFGERINANGSMDYGPARLDVGTGGAYEPSLAWDGMQFTLAYERREDTVRSAIELTRIKGTLDGLDVSKTAEAIATRGLLPAAVGGAKGATFLSYSSIGSDELAAPRIALGLFTDSVTAPGGSSSGGTTAPGGGGETGGPDSPGGSTTRPGATTPKAPPTKGATVKGGANGGADGEDGEGGGCSMTTHSSSASGSLVFLAIGALVLRRRRRA